MHKRSRCFILLMFPIQRECDCFRITWNISGLLLALWIKRLPAHTNTVPRENVFFPPRDAEKPNAITICLDFEKSRRLGCSTCWAVTELVLRDAGGFIQEIFHASSVGPRKKIVCKRSSYSGEERIFSKNKNYFCSGIYLVFPHPAHVFQ